MNVREHAIAEKYKKMGWTVLHEGAPDFLLIKQKKNTITAVEFVEVKRQGKRLTYTQKVWREALQSLGAKYTEETLN